jgi:hypothetical protein
MVKLELPGKFNYQAVIETERISTERKSMLWQSPYHRAIWRSDLKVQTNRILQNLPMWLQKLPGCSWLLVSILILGRAIGLPRKAIEKMPNWLIMSATVMILAGIALSVNEVKIQSVADLISKPAIKAVFGSAESIAITAAVILYFKEARDRKTRKHYEATQALDCCIFTSSAPESPPTSAGLNLLIQIGDEIASK